MAPTLALGLALCINLLWGQVSAAPSSEGHGDTLSTCVTRLSGFVSYPATIASGEETIMPPLRHLPAKDAIESLIRDGAYIIDDEVVGAQIYEFHEGEFPTNTPSGFEFLAQNSLERKASYEYSLVQID